MQYFPHGLESSTCFCRSGKVSVLSQPPQGKWHHLLSGCLAIRPQPGQVPLEVAKAPAFTCSVLFCVARMHDQKEILISVLPVLDLYCLPPKSYLEREYVELFHCKRYQTKISVSPNVIYYIIILLQKQNQIHKNVSTLKYNTCHSSKYHKN